MNAKWRLGFKRRWWHGECTSRNWLGNDVPVGHVAEGQTLHPRCYMV